MKYIEDRITIIISKNTIIEFHTFELFIGMHYTQLISYTIKLKHYAFIIQTTYR